MQRLRVIFATTFLLVATALCAQPTLPPGAVIVTAESSLATAAGKARQFAFDGDPSTYFSSAKSATAADHFTLVFDRPVAVKSVAVTTGKPDGGDRLDAGTLEGSADGKTFEPLAKFAAGAATAQPAGRELRAVRLRPAADLKHPLTIREIVIESTPTLATFRYPVEFIVDVSDAPDMKEWAEKTARLCERWYSFIAEELRSDGYKPATSVTMAIRSDYKGVAAAGGGRITGSASYFKKRPDDVGAMIHETVHIVQRYRGRGNPGWLVEGVADYIRFFKYEPKKPAPLTPARAKYDGSYRITAAFLDYVTEKHDKDIVRKLNQAMREGTYAEALFKQWTKKTLPELGEEWRGSLGAAPPKKAAAPPSLRPTLGE